jgi:hypothetical protein
MVYGVRNNEFIDVRSAELYGILRSRNVEGVWITVNDLLYIRICIDVVCEGVECQEWYHICSEDYFHFLAEYIPDRGHYAGDRTRDRTRVRSDYRSWGATENRRVWVEEGFDWKKEGF